MNLLSVENLSKTYGLKDLFQNISFGVEQGQRVALVARNGAGKSTLLKILQGKDIPDSGEVAFRNDVRVAFLQQEPEFNHGNTVYEALFHSDNETLKVVRAYELAQENYNIDQNNKNQEALSVAMIAMDEFNAWDYEGNIKQILTRLKIGNLNQEVTTLSGGKKKRLALARILIEDPQLMIMDEPTNHLDIEMIEWLENYFERNDISLFLVTHDRYFLDNVCTDILEIENGNMYRYRGNYEYFIEKKAEREFNEGRELDKAQQLFKKELEWVRRQPKARGTKSKSRVEAFENLKKKVTGNHKVDEISLDFKMNRIGGKILEMKKVNKAFGELKVLDHFDYTFKKGERIGIVGKNGAGKTTFLNILSGKEPIDGGKVNIGETIIFGYYSQDGMNLKEDQRVVEVVRDSGAIPMADGSKLNAVQLLNLFQFSPDLQHGFVSKLSGGEKKRLYLLTILMKNPNFLILDEPTNDLDLMTLGVLEDYLLNFNGCLIIVSHDRYFMDKLVDQLFVFEGNGVVQPFIGTYGEYRMLKSEREKEEKLYGKPEVKPEVVEVEKAPEPKKKVGFKEKHEWETLEKEIADLETKKRDTEAKLAQAGTDHNALLQLTSELQKLTEEVDTKSLRWLELSELM